MGYWIIFGVIVVMGLFLHWIYHNSSCYFYVLLLANSKKKIAEEADVPRQHADRGFRGFPGSSQLWKNHIAYFSLLLFSSKFLPQRLLLLLLWIDVHNLRQAHFQITVFFIVEHPHERAIPAII